MISPSKIIVLSGLVLLGLLPCHGQEIHMRDGRVVPAQNLKRDGNTVLSNVEIAGQIGQVGYPMAGIDHLELPKPPQMVQAEQSLAAGKFAQALAQIEPVATSQFGFRDIKGNLWAQAALLKSTAQLGLGKTTEATAILTQLSLYTLDPAAASTAKARLAGILAQGGKEQAAEAVRLADQIIASSEDRGALADAYLAKGRAYFAQDNYSDALLAFLNLPVFYDQQPTNTAAAVLGSARCYMALGDTRRGVRSYLDVQEQFPALPEAAAAKTEMEKGGTRLANIVTELKNEQVEADKQFKGEKPN
jgi:tetratricopeptide (TPR) repeat protein